MKLKRLLSLAVLCIVGMSAWAQDAGTYYIQNVETGKWLGPSNSWGSQASILPHADYWKLAKVSDGVYTLESVVSNGGTSYYLNGSYCDGAKTNLYFAAVAGKEKTYTISTANGSAYITANADNTTVVNNGADANSGYAQWKLYSEADMASLLATATATNPVDATYLVKDHNLGRHNRDYSSSWSNTGATAPKSNEKDGAGVRYSVEHYGPDRNDAFDVNQTVSNLPAGTYAVQVNGFFRQDGSVTEFPYVYANDTKVNLPICTSSENNMQAAASTFEAGGYLSAPAFVTIAEGGSIKLGVASGDNSCWNIFKNFHLTYYGNCTIAQAMANNGNITSMIINTGFEAKGGTTGWQVTTYGTHSGNSPFVGTIAEVYNWSGDADIHQTIGSLVPGFYTLSAVTNSRRTPSTLYAKNGESELESLSIGGGNDDIQRREISFYLDGTNLTIGYKSTAAGGGDRWSAIDEIQLRYLGNGVEQHSTELPAENAAADKWYKYQINMGGDYKVSSTVAATIKYTQDGTLSPAEVTTADTWTAGEEKIINLNVGYIYLNSNAASTIAIAPDSKLYNVGSATTVAYAQPGQTVTVTYADAETNDGSASLGLNGTPTITFGSESVTATATANGFTFVVPNVAAGADYTLAIPTDAFGYVGHALNEAQNITIKTPAIYDGTYYLFNTDPNVQQYMSRGGVWATSGIFDDWGLAIILNTDADGMTTFKFFDNQRYLFEQGFTFGDGTIGRKYRAAKVAGGYTFQNMETTSGKVEYLASWYGRVVNDGVVGANLFGTSNVWTIETPDEHIANYGRVADKQAATAAIAAEIDVTTLAALETVVDGYAKTIFPVTGAKGERYQWYAKEQQALAESEYYKEVLTVPAGLYKLTVNAFQRAAWNDWVADANGARGLIYLYANGAKTQLKSVFEYGADAAYTQGTNPNYARDGKNYPNSLQAAYAALETGNFQNVVYVYVPADGGKTTGTLTIGINNPTRQGNKLETGTWCVYDNWQLTLLSDGPVDYVADGVHHYIGAYTDKVVELTNEEPVVDATLATGSFNVTATNTNGLVYTNGATINGITNNKVVDGNCANLVLTDGGTFKAHKNFEATSATYTMGNVAETSAGKTFGTLMVPFAVSTQPASNTAYALTEVAFGEEIHAGTVDAIDANTPVLVTKDGNYTASHVQVAATNDTYENGQLVGTYKAMTALENTYVLQKHDSRVAFFMVKNDKPTVKPFRAYIKAQSAGARDFLNVVFDDETGLDMVNESTSQQVNQIYDLAGRRVNNAVKGIYIINGKKVIK